MPVKPGFLVELRGEAGERDRSTWTPLERF